LTECCWRSQSSEDRNAAMRGLRDVVSNVRSRHAGSGKTMLIVGHSMSGARFIQMLANQIPDGRVQLINAKPIDLIEGDPGVFLRE